MVNCGAGLGVQTCHMWNFLNVLKNLILGSLKCSSYCKAKLYQSHSTLMEANAMNKTYCILQNAFEREKRDS